MVEAHRVQDVTVVAPVGPLRAADLVAHLGAHAGDEVIFDLRGAEPVTPEVTAALATLRDRAGACCVVARSSVGAALVRFASIGDALQARALARAGYGDGWEPTAA